MVSEASTLFYSELLPFNYRTYNYMVKAVKGGMYVLPPATVTYKDRDQTVYTSTSNTVEISVG